VGHVPFEQAQRTYAAAELVVLASYFETTGLVGLEGLYQGARVVMTRRSYNDFYYGRRVTYCDPYDEGDIARALVAALREPVDPPEDGYFGRFSWPAAAAATRSAYEAALEQAEA
jgi:glycosyltransferase involved in cell wall biosynthesis